MASSSLSSEMEAEHHPFLDPEAECPKGSYESRQTKNGLYIRVDMPGVPPGRVKLYKYSETRTVTFNGRAPNEWEFDSTERVYGGYVALDRDPTKLHIEMTVINGCLRLFFPAAHGSLHFFPSKTPVQQFGGLMMYCPCQDSSSNDQPNCEPNVILGHFNCMGHHDKDCPCCEGKKKFFMVTTPNSSYTNPSLLQGVQGVCESKLVHNERGTHLYMRVDMPGIQEKGSVVMVNHKDCTAHVLGEEDKLKNYMIIGVNCPKEHRFDKHTRNYICCLILQCNCCKIGDIMQGKKDGVVRLLIQKKKKTSDEETTPINESRGWVDGHEMVM